MRPALTSLVEVIREETGLARSLVEALQEDQRRIQAADVEGLEKSNGKKETLVVRFERLEQTRSKAILRLATELGLPEDQISVSALCDRLGTESEELRESADRLRAVIGSLKELVEIGRGFLEQSILGIRNLLSLIQSMRTPESPSYDASGRFAPASSGAGAVVRREV
ncbi:MAG: flagellar protein FlgN [Myxococcota bacterium]